MKDILVWGIITGIAAIVWKIVKFIVINGVIGLFVWLLWNWLMTAAFGLPALGYIQVVGILVMLSLVADVIACAIKFAFTATENDD